MTPRLYNRHHRDAPSDAVYIGRGSPWGNPFRIGVHGNRAEVIERFRCETLPTLDLQPLRGKSLVCYCAPLPCHGDVLLQAAAEFGEGKRMMDVLGSPWRELPLGVRQAWWAETDYSRTPPSPEFMARLPQLMVAEQAKEDARKRRIAADTARGREMLSQARTPPCEQCLRSPPCAVRCLRSMFTTAPDGFRQNKENER